MGPAARDVTGPGHQPLRGGRTESICARAFRSSVWTMKHTRAGKRISSIDEVVYGSIVTTRTGQCSEIDDREVGEHAYIEHWICEKVHDCSDSQSAQSIIFCSRHRSMSTLSFDWQSYDLKPASDSTALVTM